MGRYVAGRESSASIDDAAASWAARVDRGPLSPEDAKRLEDWLSADARRFGAFARARAVLSHFDRARALGAGFDPATFSAKPAGRAKWFGALAASLVLAAGLAAYVALAPERFTTKVGEVRAFSLDDGSRVTLNTASSLQVRYTEGERRVQLVAGEALFVVAKDSARPFIVEARGAHIRAVGTSFSVRNLPEEAVQVLVREGVVQVAHEEGGRAVEPVTLTANTRAEALPSQPVRVAKVSEEDVTRELAWRDGMISFAGVTLREAAREFARYSDVRIVFDDPELADRTVTGLFASNNPVGFARAIATSMDLTVEARPDAVHLSRKQP